MQFSRKWVGGLTHMRLAVTPPVSQGAGLFFLWRVLRSLVDRICGLVSDDWFTLVVRQGGVPF
jgi:hypothetical protein